MEFRIRHMAIFLYGGIAALGIVLKPELIATMTDLVMLLAPFIGMFTWDKIEKEVLNRNGTATTTTVTTG